MIGKVIVKTLSGTSPEALATDETKVVRLGCLVMADSGDTVYIGQEGVTSDTGFLLPTTPGDALELGSVEGLAGETIDLTQLYVVGTAGDKVRIFHLAKN